MPETDALLSGARRVGSRLLRRLGVLAAGKPAATQVPPADRRRTLEQGWFVNPIAEGADPFVVRDGDRYLWCQTAADVGVAVWSSDRLTSLGHKHLVWQAPETGPYSKQVWAPEMHHVDGRWHIYFAASDGRNENHLAYVLVADSDDPVGSYSLHGPLNTGDGTGGTADNAWAIDMTLLAHGGRRYALWSGWPDAATKVQHLYIAEMATPTLLAGRRVLISSPFDHPWERIREGRAAAINEAPQALLHGGRTFVVYSCGSALLPSYKLGLLELVRADPLDPASWRKKPAPVFTSTRTTFGVGHSSFVRSPDDSEWWQAFHAKVGRERDFRRVVHVQPMGWSDDGEPMLGEPVAAGTPLREPAGTRHQPRHEDALWRFGSRGDGLADFDYHGHQQYVSVERDGLHLGRVPRHPVNAYRTGEKVTLRDGDFRDVRVSASFTVADGSRAVGVVVRATGMAVGFEAQRGYFAAWVPRRGRLVLRRSDGESSVELASRAVPAAAGSVVTLVVAAVGATVSAHLAEAPELALEVEDTDYAHGTVGLRVVNTHAVFSTLRVEPVATS